MTLIQFINHLKHKSIWLNIFYNAKIIYLGDVGSYMHWVNRNVFDNCKIIKIEPIPTDSLNIFINVSEPKKLNLLGENDEDFNNN